MTTFKKNISLSFITALSKLIGGIGILILLARFLSLSEFGMFTYILTITSSIILFVDYGFNIKLLIDIPRNNNLIEKTISIAILIKCLFFIFISSVILIVYYLDILEIEQFLLTSSVFISLFLFSINNTFLSVFKSTNRYLLEMKIVVVDNILSFTLVCMALFFSEEIYLIGIALVSAKTISCILSYYYYNQQFTLYFVDFRKQINEIRIGFPFAIHYIIGNIFLNIDTLILAYFVSQQDLGIYQSGIRLIIGSGVLLTIVNSIYLPLLSKEAQLIDKTKELNLYLIIIACLIAFPFLFFPETIILLIYGSEFLSAIELFRIFGIIIFLRIIGSSYGIILSISDKQIYRALALIISGFLICILDFWLIPRSDNMLLTASYVLLFSHIIITGIYMLISFKRYQTFFMPSKQLIIQKINSFR